MGPVMTGSAECHTSHVQATLRQLYFSGSHSLGACPSQELHLPREGPRGRPGQAARQLGPQCPLPARPSPARVGGKDGVVHLASHRVPFLQAAGRVVARLQEDQCQGLSAACGHCGTGRCSRLGWAGSQGHLPCLAAPLLQLPDELQEVHLQGQLLGCRWDQGFHLSPGRAQGSSLFPQALEATMRFEGH